MTVATHLGGSVGFYSGNVAELLDDVLVSVGGVWVQGGARAAAAIAQQPSRGALCRALPCCAVRC
jgi:hypothetical protein